jgi:ABC-type glycerol-3-phosphate transport system permease component
MAEQTTEQTVGWSAREPLRLLTGSMTWRRRFMLGIGLLLVSLGAIVELFPLAWMISTALKDQYAVMALPPEWIPNPIHWENFREALTFMPFDRYFLNTALITGLGMLGDVGSSALIAFAFARLRAPGRNLLFGLVLSTLMLPWQVTLIPTYVLFAKLQWVDTYKPLIVPTYFGAAFYIFLLRQYYMTIPFELDEAATIDGAGWLRIFWQIILPLARAPLATVAVFSFLFHWNEFIRPIVYISSSDKYTLSMALQGFTGMFGTTRWDLLMAASLAVVLPCLLLFFFAQRYFIEGIVMTGIKG